MTTTDVLLVVTIVLLMCVTGMNMSGGSRTCPVPCPTYIPRPCGDGFTPHGVYDNFAGDNPLEYEGFADDVDELTNHPKSRGLVPQVKQPHHTKNLWKTSSTQPGYDTLGRRHTLFSSDLLTPFKDQVGLNRVDSNYKEPKFPGMGSTIFEDFVVHPYEEGLEVENTLENETDPTIKRMLN